MNNLTEAPLPVPSLTAGTIQQIHALAQGRDSTIKAIREALKRRSGKAWSVTGGCGTAWGWITIDAPPARRTWGSRPLPHNPGGYMPGRDNWEDYDTGIPGRTMSPADCAELGRLLGHDGPVHCQGESIAASSDYRRVAICRALYGHPGPFTAEPYWD